MKAKPFRSSVCGRVASLVIVALSAVPSFAAAQEEVATRWLGPWVAERGAVSRTDGEVIAIGDGLIRTKHLLSDFVLRIQFRLMEPSAEAGLFIRSRFGYGPRRDVTIGYRVVLTNKSTGNDAVGRVIGSEVTMPQISYNPPSSLRPPGEWQDCEVRAERGTLAIRLNGTLVTTVGDVDELTGYIGLQQRRGKVEFRRAQVTTLPPSKEPFGLGAFTLKGTSIVPPRVVKEIRPFYPRAPFESGVEGTVLVEAVVDASGSVGDVRVVKSLDPDLDQAAVAAARRWRFTPATDAGKPVPVIVTIEIAFHIRQ